jgi:hypothetical protein
MNEFERPGPEPKSGDPPTEVDAEKIRAETKRILAEASKLDCEAEKIRLETGLLASDLRDQAALGADGLDKASA